MLLISRLFLEDNIQWTAWRLDTLKANRNGDRHTSQVRDMEEADRNDGGSYESKAFAAGWLIFTCHRTQIYASAFSVCLESKKKQLEHWKSY